MYPAAFLLSSPVAQFILRNEGHSSSFSNSIEQFGAVHTIAANPLIEGIPRSLLRGGCLYFCGLAVFCIRYLGSLLRGHSFQINPNNP